jgi:arginyl-tRNA synthetase
LLEGSAREAIARALDQAWRALRLPGDAPLARVRSTREARFGDYQSELALEARSASQAPPRELAAALAAALQASPPRCLARVEVAGPGFLNFSLDDAWLGERVQAAARAQALGDLWPAVDPAERETIVVDFSGPNLAKQLHVGHLRSTVLGDVIARWLDARGHRVVRQNHVGDFGTQFGMLCALLRERATGDVPPRVEDLEALYREANARRERDAEFRERAEAEVVALHRGAPETRAAWEAVLAASRAHYEPLYDRLGVRLGRAEERGESFYADRLESLVHELERRFGAAPDSAPLRVERSEGAVVLFHRRSDGQPVFSGKDGCALPLLVRKSDGAFLYATTDLAALRYRIEDLGADRVIYVTDDRQTLHFAMLFETARAAGWLERSGHPSVRLEHVAFGPILGADNRPLKTRSGDNVKLVDVLDESERRARDLIEGGSADLSPEEAAAASKIIGTAAVKYAILRAERESSIVFRWDTMLAMTGNCAPALLYTYARTRSILRRGGTTHGRATPGPFAHGSERALALALVRFPEALEDGLLELRVHGIAEYLSALAGTFGRFYESCPVLKAATEAERDARLTLVGATERVLGLGLGLLGIPTPERL